jgi:hypothetical protein
LSDFVPDRVTRSSRVSPLEVKLGTTAWAENGSCADDVFNDVFRQEKISLLINSYSVLISVMIIDTTTNNKGKDGCILILPGFTLTKENIWFSL